MEKKEFKQKRRNIKIVKIIIITLIIVVFLVGIIISVNSKYYKYNTATNYLRSKDYANAEKIYKTINTYKDSKNKIIECKYKMAKVYLKKKNYIKSIKLLSEIGNYKDSKLVLQESKYKYGIYLNKEYMYEESNEYLNDVIDYKDSKEYIEKNNKKITLKKWKKNYTGTFLNTTYSNDKVVLSGGTTLSRYLDYPLIKSVINEEYSCTFTDDFSLDCRNTKVYASISTATVKIQDDKLVISYKQSGNVVTQVYSKKSNTLDRTADYKEPKIGMSKNEVLNSKWGSPKRKNIDEFSWGTTEQWVYSNNRYIYFEDGKVTSISK